DPDATVEDTAIKELEEETGFTADHIEVIGEFFSSPGMVAEGFTLVRAHGLKRIGDGGGTENEKIEVHLVPRAEIPAFVAGKRAEGCAIDTKMLLLLAADILGGLTSSMRTAACRNGCPAFVPNPLGAHAISDLGGV